MSQTMKTTEVTWPSSIATVTVPFARRFEDYHEINSYKGDMNNVLQISCRGRRQRLKAFEVGNDGFHAIAVFYVDKRPNRAQLKAIVERDCGIPDKCDYEWVWESN